MKVAWTGRNRYTRLLVWVLLAILVLTLSGCSSALEEEAAAAPKPESAKELAAGSNQLAFELLRKLYANGNGENVVTAPLSISALLAILLSGARGETADELAATLHLDGGWEAAADFGQLLRHVSQTDAGVELNVGNAVWANKGYPLTEEFTETMENDFAAGVSELELGSQEGADTIDSWVAENTEGLIEKMSDALNLPDPNAVIVLMNAIYFKGTWTQQFDAERTQPGTFTLADGTEVQVPMMTQRREFRQAEGAKFKLLRLHYGEEKRFAMDVLLPNAELGIDAFANSLETADWLQAVSDLSESSVQLILPKFELEYKAARELDAALKELGLTLPYSPQADFTGMSPQNPFLSKTAHKTYIRVDEEGTEAAGVTGGAMTTAMPAEFRVDRPFAFIISDTETEAILFMGVVTNPAD